jgi:hypothetical protein
MCFRVSIALAICCVTVVLLAGRGAPIPAPALAQEPSAAPDINSRRALLEAAKATYAAYLKRRQIEVLAVDPEYLYRWSRRWLQAERALADSKNKRVAACAAHLERMRGLETLEDQMVRSAAAAPGDLHAVKFYRIEAEQLLAEAKAK